MSTVAPPVPAPPRRRKSTKLKRRQTRLAWFLLVPSLAVVAFVALYPLGKTIFQSFTDEESDILVRQGAGQHVDQMFTYAAVGTPDEVADYLVGFQTVADADELITAHQARSPEGRLRSVTLTAEAMDSAAA